MNINVLIDQIKKRGGLQGILKGIYDDSMIRDIILNDTLVTFKRFNTFLIRIPCDTLMNRWPRKPVDSSNGMDLEVMIPDEMLEEFKLLGTEIVGAYITRRSMYPLSGGMYSRGMKDDLMCYQSNQMNRANWDMPKALWRSPNTIVLKDWGLSTYQAPIAYLLHLKCTHARNLSTITKGVEQMFSDLAYYDVLLNLYNNDLKMMSVSANGATVDLNTEPFASAESKREDLLAKIRKLASNDNMVLDF